MSDVRCPGVVPRNGAEFLEWSGSPGRVSTRSVLTGLAGSRRIRARTGKVAKVRHLTPMLQKFPVEVVMR